MVEGKKNTFWQQNRFNIILLISIVVGCVIGLIFGEKATVLKPLGTILMNLLFVSVVPLVLSSVIGAIGNFADTKKLGKLVANMFIVFILTSLVATVFMLVVVVAFPPAAGADIALEAPGEIETINTIDSIVNAFTTDDFNKLLSRSHILALIVFSMIFGFAITKAGEKGKKISEFFVAMTEVCMQTIKIIMYYAPIGLAGFFASLVGEYGSQMIGSYGRVFLIYVAALVVYCAIFLSLFAFIAAGTLGVKRYWKGMFSTIVTAFGTQSSIATLPVNLAGAEKIGIPKYINDIVLVVGASAHTEAACLSGILKIAFLFGLFGVPFTGFGTFASAFLVAMLSGVVMSGIPGGGMIGELLIVSLYGFPPEAFTIIVTIGWIIDAPATVLAVIGDTTCAMLVARIMEGKDWLKKRLNPDGTVKKELTSQPPPNN
ncbi:MAG: dicarboxylate/amino acid:cation symporter [Clostridiaceae bacterium]|jgi:Na+/H+-dicarboxylate symporter|nr:dicarboxylate/amino acid:cation symporter [Clostridiaceae bacterium]